MLKILLGLTLLTGVAYAHDGSEDVTPACEFVYVKPNGWTITGTLKSDTSVSFNQEKVKIGYSSAEVPYVDKNGKPVPMSSYYYSAEGWVEYPIGKVSVARFKCNVTNFGF